MSVEGHKPEEIVSDLWQVEVPHEQDITMSDAFRRASSCLSLGEKPVPTCGSVRWYYRTSLEASSVHAPPIKVPN